MILNDTETTKFCTSIKTEYYKRNIKMLYSWPNMGFDEIKKHLNALGLNDHLDAIIWLLTHKASLNVEINIQASILIQDQIEPTERAKILDKMKVALIVCNKAQAVKILSSIALSSHNIEDEILNIETF